MKHVMCARYRPWLGGSSAYNALPATTHGIIHTYFFPISFASFICDAACRLVHVVASRGRSLWTVAGLTPCGLAMLGQEKLRYG